MEDQLRREGVPEANVKEATNLLAGQAIAESGMNPKLSHDSGTGYGIYGARLGRRSGMFAWMEKNGYAKDSLEGQSRYMAHEAMTGKDYGKTRSALMGAEPGSRAARTDAITRNFEAPARINNRTGMVSEAEHTQTGPLSPGEPANGQSRPTMSNAEAAKANTVATGDRVMGGGRSLKGTDPRISNILAHAAEGLPPGYKIQSTSGVRTAGQGQHTKGNAQDWQIIGPDGAVRNRGDDVTGLYTTLAKNAYGYQEKNYPELTGKFQWGGQFGTSAKNPNEPDLMHFDASAAWRGLASALCRENIGSAMPPTPTDRIDSAGSAKPPQGSVAVTINSNGTKASASAKADGFFADTKVEQHKQSRSTNETSESMNI